MAHRSSRRRARRRGRFSGLYKLLSALLILAALVAGCLVFFRAEGVAVPGEILSVDRLAWINWNTSTLWNWPGVHSPWRLRCAYRYGGERYQVKSDLLWREPVRSGWRPTVYLDPGNPRRAVVDLDTVPLTL